MDPGPFERLLAEGGRRYADLLAHRRVLDGEVPIPFLDAEGLILLKSGSERPQDRLDVEALERARRSPPAEPSGP